jgi:glycerol-3-phosphate dehydrogenase
MILPRVGIIGTGWFGCALRDAWTPLIGKTISGIDMWKRISERPKIDPEILVLAIPSTAKNGEKFALLDYIESFPLASVIVTSKGRKALKIFQNHISPNDKWRVFSLSGPNLADQIGHTPTATKIAGNSLQSAEFLARTLSSNFLHVEASESIEIVQRGGMMKNFLVFELGKLWEKLNTPQMKIEAIIMALHAGFDSINTTSPGEEDRSEFFGLSGLGDILLCLGIFPQADGSRNFRAGQLLASGKNYEEVLEEFKTLEGLIMSQKFHEGIRTRSFCGEKMDRFRAMTQGESPLIPQKNKFPALTILMRSIWKKFLEKAKEQNFQSNTHAWTACELLSKVASANLVLLTRWENAEPFVRALLETLLIEEETISIESVASKKIWNQLIKNLPFLKTTSSRPDLKHLLPATCRHSTRRFLGWNWTIYLPGVQRWRNKGSHRSRRRK